MASTAKLTAELVIVNDSTDSSASFCVESCDLVAHENHLQAPKNPVLVVNAHGSNETSLRSSVTNIAAEVFTAKSISVALKCRVVITLIVIICLMILLFLAPIIWYNTNPPTAGAYVTEKTVFYNLEVDDCTVSKPVLDFIQMWLLTY